MLWQREAISHVQDVINILEKHQPKSNVCLIKLYQLKQDILEAFPIENYGIPAPSPEASR